MEKKIHYCWFGGKKLPKSVIKCIKTWKKVMPDYEIVEWNESNFDINICPFVKDAYKSKKWAFVSDYARIYALYNEGGIYLDTDVKILKKNSEILDKEMFLGYEDSGFVGTAVIGVKEKHNKYIKEILDYYNKQEEFNPEIMYNYANPIIITKILKNYDSYIDDKGVEIFDNNVSVYPREYFYPLSYNYAEKEFTDNTCMIHLFNATWTSLGEKRTINVYRKLGPDLGKIVNNFIDGLGNIKFKIKNSILKMLHSIKMFISIHLNRNKRVNKIENEIKKIKDKEILICNPDFEFENYYLDCISKNKIFIREQYTNKEANMIAKKIIENNIEKVIFNSLSNGWNLIINNLKKNNKNIKIEVILHGGSSLSENNYIWQLRDNINELYAKHKVDKLLVFNESMYNFLKLKNYRVELKNRNILIDNKEKYIKNKDNNKKLNTIGIYQYNEDCFNNIYTQIKAISLLENIKLDSNIINYRTATISRRFNVNLQGNGGKLSKEELYNKLVNNDLNLAINMIDMNSVLPIESFELGTVCLIGSTCELFKNSELENKIKIKNIEDIIEIKEKIEYALNNKEEILGLYTNWKNNKIKS